MHALSLRFDSEVLEDGYTTFLLSEGLWKNDVRFFWFVAVVNALSFARVWNQGHQDPWLLAPQFAGWWTIALIFLWRWKVKQESGMPWWRDWLVGIARIWLVSCISLVEKRILDLSDMSEGLVVAMVEGAWSNHAFQLILVAFALRMKFTVHVVVQGLMVAAMVCLDGGRFCSHVINSNHEDTIVHMEETLDDFSHWVLTAMYARFRRPPVRSPDECEFEPCRRLSLFVHLFGGLGMVSYGVWLLEMWSRAAFLKSIENDPHMAHIEKPIVRWNTMWMICHHIPLIGIALVLTWQGVTIIPRIISDY